MAAKLEDSNMANYGGKDHQDLKLAKAQAEKEYEGAGSVEGLEIWRVENFGVKKITDRKLHGKFFGGDSYIVLNSYRKSSDSKKLDYNVHFWLGANSTQDERGTAALKTIELDDLLGDLPVQYRECQGHESVAFLKLFGGAITVMKGGIAGAFNIVKPKTYTPRLMQFKGQKRIRVSEVPLACSSLNMGDVFLLDAGLQLIQWNGPGSGARERRSAMEYIVKVKDERLGRATHTVLDGKEEHEFFWKTLGGMGEIAPATPDTKITRPKPTLHQVSDSTGELKVTQVASGKREMKAFQLDEDDVFIADMGTILYVWVGSGANRAERRNAMRVASQFLERDGRPAHTPISRVCSGRESNAFLTVMGRGKPGSRASAVF
jgi:hypothetical protein